MTQNDAAELAAEKAADQFTEDLVKGADTPDVEVEQHKTTETVEKTVTEESSTNT